MYLYDVPGLVHPCGGDGEMYVDIGAYGEPKVAPFVAKETVRKLEEYVRGANG